MGVSHNENIMTWWITPLRLLQAHTPSSSYMKCTKIPRVYRMYPDMGLKNINPHIKLYTLWLFNSSPWKIHPFLRTVNHLFLWAMAIPWQSGFQREHLSLIGGKVRGSHMLGLTVTALVLRYPHFEASAMAQSKSWTCRFKRVPEGFAGWNVTYLAGKIR